MMLRFLFLFLFLLFLLFIYFIFLFLGLLLEQGCPCLGSLLAFYSITRFHCLHCCALLSLYVYVPVCVTNKLDWIGLDCNLKLLCPDLRKEMHYKMMGGVFCLSVCRMPRTN